MKHLTTLVALIMITGLTVSAQTGSVSSDQPYKVQATNITLGNDAYGQKILWAWKYYDDNTLDKVADLFADDVVATFPDGSVIKGKDNFMKGMKDYRNGFTSNSSTIDACVTLKTPDMPDHEVVSIWGAETSTAKDGTVSKTRLNEIWMFNKDGKVVQFHQFAAKEPSDQK